MAAGLLAETSLNDAARVQAIYERAYGRPPTPLELSRALQYVERYYQASTATKPDPAESRLQALAKPLPAPQCRRMNSFM